VPRTPIVVVDASFAVARLRVEEQTTGIIERFRDWSRDGTRIVVPRPFWWEVANTLAVRHRQTGAQVLEAVHTLETFRIESRDLDRGQLLLTIGAVERFGLTAYDAQYLLLAETLGAEMATLDRRLALAAGARAIAMDDRWSGHRLSESRVPYEHEVTWPNYKGASAYLAELRAEAREPSPS
jgi:predicted nucleic acid-binding protein